MSTGKEKMLTEKQTEIVAWIRKFIAQHGYSPTIREIASGLGYRSPNGAYSQLCRLYELGRITWTDGVVRSIRVVEETQ
jgi:repressor LexA